MPMKAFHTSRTKPVEHIRKSKRSTAVLAEPYYKGQQKSGQHSSNTRRCDRDTWRILFDSGSDGDLLFIPKGSSKKQIPYCTRTIAQNWRTSNGHFSTDRIADLELIFPEYSHSKRIKVAPDMVYLHEGDPEPLYDVIIGTESMHHMGAN